MGVAGRRLSPTVPRPRPRWTRPLTDLAPRTDAAPRRGTARAALAHREFRLVFAGSFASNIGRWMQNVALGAFAYDLTGSAAFVGLMLFAQLSPMLVLSVVGGLAADTLDRRRLLIVTQVGQMALSVVLAALVATGDPSRVALLATVAGIGVLQAVYAPTFSAVLPSLVRREDLAGAISLNSTQINVSRVLGPAVNVLVYPWAGVAGVMLFNAATYGFVLAALLVVRLPAVERVETGSRGARRLLDGFNVARRNPLYRRILLTMTAFSLLCLPFIGQLPVLAGENLDLAVPGTTYWLLYGTFGVGAVGGSLAVGTVLAHRDRSTVVRNALGVFAGLLLVLALLRSPGPAFPVLLAVGFVYLATVTTLSTLLQEHLPDGLRGQVMALWVMSFGGTVPIANIIAGPLIEATSVTLVVGGGAVAAIVLMTTSRLSAAVEVVEA